MALSYLEALQFEVSGKRVYATGQFKKRVFDLTLDGAIYYAPLTTVFMNSMTERIDNEGSFVAMQEAASEAALIALDTSAVGGWWWDFANERVYVKQKASTSVFDNGYIAATDWKMSVYGGELNDELHEARLSRAPATTQQGSEVLDGRVVKIGAGNTDLINTDALIIDEDLEPDGVVTITRQLEVLR